MCLNHLAINTGYYMVIPILSILLTREKLLSLSEIALVLLVFSSTIRGSQFFTGPFLDTLSSKTTLVLGALLTGGSFVLMGYVRTLPLLLLCSVLTGLGASANLLAAKVYVAKVSSKEGKSLLYFSTLNVAANVASSVGVLIGSALLAGSQNAVIFQLTGVCYLFAAVAVLLLLPSEPKDAQSLRREGRVWTRYRDVLADSAYLRTLPFIFFGWFCYTQMYAVLPYFVSMYYHMADKLGLLFTLNALLIITLQLVLSVSAKKFVSQRNEHFLFLFSYLLYGLAFLCAGLFLSFGGILGVVVLLTLAEMFFTPSADTLVSTYARPGLQSTYFSVSGIARALGEGIGSYVGLSWLGFWLQQAHVSLFWFSLLVLVGIACLGFWLSEYMTRTAARNAHRASKSADEQIHDIS
jgi:MFS family permease